MLPQRPVQLLCLLLGAAACAVAGPDSDPDLQGTVIGTPHIQLRLVEGQPRFLTAPDDPTILAEWTSGQGPVFVTVQGNGTPVPPGPPTGITVGEDADGGSTLTLTYRRTEAPAYDACLEIRAPTGARFLEFRLELTNRSGIEFSRAGLSGGLGVPRGRDHYVVLPFQSGVLLPLDQRFEKIRLFDAWPFVLGYPSNWLSMQWLGVQAGAADLLIMSTDRYGWLKRLGAEPESSERAALVAEYDASLPPGETVALPPLRFVIPEERGYSGMARHYRDWVRERTSRSGVCAGERSGGITKTPLQFIPLTARGRRRPWLHALTRVQGYPEHVVRRHQGKPFACAPYGLVLEKVEVFPELYGAPLTAHLWSFTRPFDDGSWPLFPVVPEAEADHTQAGVRYPGIEFVPFLRAVQKADQAVLLYTNPTFWGKRAPGYTPEHMHDTTGQGQIALGGLAAQASEDQAYVSPHCVQETQVAEMRRLPGGWFEPEPQVIMYDSSQAFGGTLYNNSVWRGDPVTDVDRNPRAAYRERYGYVGRDSLVQDRIRRDLALDRVTPKSAKVGEWISEMSSMYLDMNAGSIDLKREFPDTVEREPDLSPVPVPLFQMVYGDTQYYTIRVGAAADATLNEHDLQATVLAAMSRRATTLFGGVHQILHWGGVPWANTPESGFSPHTYLVVRDNLARQALFGHRAGYRMRDPRGVETVGLFTIRETAWLDRDGTPVAVSLDNNTGRTVQVHTEVYGPPLAVESLWGAEPALPGSLGRLNHGSSLTVTRGGTFAAWDFAGRFQWGEGLRLDIVDSDVTPEGLTVIWDGERLTLGNTGTEEREVRVAFHCPDAAAVSALDPVRVQGRSGREYTASYRDSEFWDALVQDGSVTVFARLPAAAPGPERTIPTSLLSFEIGR